MNSIIEITFNTVPVNTNSVSFESTIGGSPRTHLETWQDGARVDREQIQVPTPSTVNQAAADFVTYFNIDFNFAGAYIVTRVANVVTIELVNPLATWQNFSSTVATANITNSNNVEFVLVSDTLSAGDTPCDDFKITIQTTSTADKVEVNGVEVLTGNVDNPFTLDLLRGVAYRLKLYNTTGDTVQSFLYPNTLSPLLVKKLVPSLFDINIENSIQGATVTVVANQSLGFPELEFEYSLDDASWQTENYFIGQAEGDYTVYIRDVSLGCKVSIDYSVTAFNQNVPFLFIGRANSVNFIEQVSIDDCSVFRNEDNSYAHQELRRINYCTEILFNNCDSTTIQLKSNYSNVQAFLRKEDLTEVELVVTRMSANLNRFQNMDCVIYRYAPNKLGIYFTSGSTYDEGDLEIPNGDYTLNGNLPDFAIIGEFVDISGGIGYKQITDVVYDASIEMKAIIVDFDYTGSPDNRTIKSLYDLLPYEIYQFDVDWATYGNGLYDLKIVNSGNYDEVVHISENILVSDSNPGTLAVRYYNENNRDIFYLYGIQHFIRVPYIDIKPDVDDEVEINIGDLTTDLNRSILNEKDVIQFGDLTTRMMKKLAVALSCENLFINGIGYVKKESLSIEHVEGTNLCTVTATLIKTNTNWSNNRQGQTGVDYDYESINVPSFITDGTNFLKQ